MEAGDRQLPRGRHGLPPEEVAENQRWRLLTGAAEVLAERGYAHVTSARIARAAGVSSGTFYRYFENVDACLLAAYEMAAECVWDLAAGACVGEGEWPQRLAAALHAALDFLATEPALAHLLGAEAAAGIAAVAAARESLHGRLAGLLCGGRQLQLESANDLPAGLERHLLGGLAGLLGAHVVAGEASRLPQLATELTQILATPYRKPAP